MHSCEEGVVRCYIVKGVWRSLLFVCLASNPSMTFPNRVLIESRFLVQPKHIWGFPVDAVVKNPPTNAGDKRRGFDTWAPFVSGHRPARRQRKRAPFPVKRNKDFKRTVSRALSKSHHVRSHRSLP